MLTSLQIRPWFLILFFLVVLVSWILLICRIELLDTPVQYESAVENLRKKKKAQKRFAVQEFLQNCYWADLLSRGQSKIVLLNDVS